MKSLFSAIADLIIIISLSIGAYLNYVIVDLRWGPIAAIIGFLLFPIGYLITPIYALLKYGDWFPTIIIYGGLILFLLFEFLGDKDFFGDKDEFIDR